MKKKIEKMIEEIKAGNYDNEILHGQYDSLLEDFIFNYNPDLVDLMRELIYLEKDFWYA